jgi:predicted NAD/FAD-binding protein
MNNKKIAIIGSGISGLGLAYIAVKNNLAVTLFEQNSYFGGHSNTIDIQIDEKILPVDTGFLVHNKVTYPNLIQLFDLLETDIVDSDMSLSIQVEDLNFEWGGSNLNTVFGQRRNILKPGFYSFLLEILDFNKKASAYLEWAKADKSRTLNDLLINFNYSTKIKDWYLIPMAAAIWSTPADKILEFPAHTFLTFSINHHLLQVKDRPVWRTVKNGTRNYVSAITNLIEDKRLNQKVTAVEFRNDKVYITSPSDASEEFDQVVFAGHADQTVKIIKGITSEQAKILESFKFEKNVAHVHSDESFLPKRKLLWSAWNYINSPKNKSVSVSYLINKLQPLQTTKSVIVTLNPHRPIDAQKTYKVIEYRHPLFDTKAILAQAELNSIQGINNMFFAGAWGGYGFHEDGLKSAVRVAKVMNLTIPWKAVL